MRNEKIKKMGKNKKNIKRKKENMIWRKYVEKDATMKCKHNPENNLTMHANNLTIPLSGFKGTRI